MPRLPKPKALRQNTERKDVGLVVVNASPAAPPPAHTWLKVTKEAWEEFWSAPLAATVMPSSDMPDLRRLFDLRDERERASAGFKAERLVEGSMGQPRLNPLGPFMLQLDAQINQLAEKFGMTPQARLKLGVTFAHAQDTLEDMRRAVENPREVGPATEEDPRLTVYRG